MSTFRDDEILIQQTRKSPRPRFRYMTIDLSTQDCQYYGHSWQTTSTTGVKCCTICGVTGYCPGCTPVSPTKVAHSFYCTKHTPSQDREVQV